MSAKPTISVFGSTGGTGLATLRFCLAGSYQCTTMVRNPAKLLDLLSLTEAPSNLTIIKGEIKDAAAVQRTLLSSEGKIVDIVISCIGFVPSLTPGKVSLNLFANIDDPSICERGTTSIVSAISNLSKGATASESLPVTEGTSSKKNPLLVVLSTTGVSSAGRDVPFLMLPLYHLLAPPHKDKRAMEDFLKSSAVASTQPWTVIRPAFLVGDGKGEPSKGKVRVGIEKDGKRESKAIGYTIKREDVGNWIFKEIVQGQWERWVGKAVTLTY